MAEKNIQGLTKLAKTYSEKNDVSVAEAERVIGNVFQLLFDSLNKIGDQVDINNTLHIKVVEKAGRNGINPHTLEKTFYPASVGLKVTLGKALKAKLNGK